MRWKKRSIEYRTKNLLNWSKKESWRLFNWWRLHFNTETNKNEINGMGFLISLINHLAKVNIEGAYFVLDNVRFHRTEFMHIAVALAPFKSFFKPS